MEKVFLSLTYGNIALFNLSKTWIQPMVMSSGYQLCYEDDKYNRGIIYRSDDKNSLKRIQNKLMRELDEGKKLIKLP